MAANQYIVDQTLGSDGIGVTGKLDDDDPWQTWAKVDGFSFATSDEIYFKCGDTHTLTASMKDWSVRHGGTSGAYAKAGAWYYNVGVPTIGVSGNRPILQGNYDSSNLGAKTGDPNYYPNAYNGIISVTGGYSYFAFENLQLLNSGFYGFLAGVSGVANDFITLTNCYISNTWRQAIVLFQSDNNTVDNSEVYLGNYGFRTYGPSVGGGACCVSSHGDSNTWTDNLIHVGGGEGINSYRSTNCTGSGNTLFDQNDKYLLYFDHAVNCSFFNNILIHKGGTGPGIGIIDESAGEPYARNSQIYIYNNLLAGGSNGIVFNIQPAIAAPRNPTDIYIYHNTIVDFGTAMVSNNNITSFITSEVKNNIFASYLAGTMSSGNATGLVCDYNNWHTSVSGNWSGVNDVIGDPLLSKTTGWQSAAVYTDIDSNDFKLLTGSPADGACLVLAGYTTDFNGVSRGSVGAPTDMGALVLAVANTTATPTGVAGSGSIGAATVVSDIPVAPTGNAGAGQIGAVSVTGDANVAVTGSSGGGTLGTVSALIRTPGELSDTNVTQKVPEYYDNLGEWTHQVAAALNRVLDGKLNATGEVTLAASTTTTVVTDFKLGNGSTVSLTPITATAAAEITTTYVQGTDIDATNGQFTVTHASNSITDRKFRYVILG